MEGPKMSRNPNADYSAPRKPRRALERQTGLRRAPVDGNIFGGKVPELPVKIVLKGAGIAVRTAAL